MLIRIDDYQVLQHLTSCIEAFEKAVDEPLTGQLIHIGKYTITVQPRNENASNVAAEEARLAAAAAELLGALRNALPPDLAWFATDIRKPMSEHVSNCARTVRGRRFVQK